MLQMPSEDKVIPYVNEYIKNVNGECAIVWNFEQNALMVQNKEEVRAAFKEYKRVIKSGEFTPNRADCFQWVHRGKTFYGLIVLSMYDINTPISHFMADRHQNGIETHFNRRENRDRMFEYLCAK